MKLLGLSTEHSKESADNTSFLSCVSFSITKSSQTIVSESSASTTFVDLRGFPGDVEVNGECEALIKCGDISGYVGQMPTDEDIVVEINTEEKTYSVYNDSETIVFSSALVNIIDDDMRPQAISSFNGDYVDVPPVDLNEVYKRGSSMSRRDSGEDITGFDPFSGSFLTITEKGVQCLSLSTSSSEAYLPADNSIKKKQDILTLPSITAPRIDAMAAAGDATMSIGVGSKDGRLHVGSSGYHMTIMPINTGRKNTQAISFTTILNVLQPAWKNRRVTVKVSASEFFSALGRASTISADSMNMTVSDVDLTITSEKNSASAKPFKQTITCSTVWHDDSPHKSVMKASPSMLKIAGQYVPKNTDLIFDIAFKDNGDPWALMIHDDQYDEKDPHDFFMVSLFT